MITLKTRDGREVGVQFTDGGRIMALEKATIGDIKPGSYIGVAAVPQPDGSQRALAVHIFTEAQRGVAEGHRPWDLLPESTMTNAAVETMVARVDGPLLTVKYKDGEQKIIVPPATPIVAYAPGDRSAWRRGDDLSRSPADRWHLSHFRDNGRPQPRPPDVRAGEASPEYAQSVSLCSDTPSCAFGI
jgi:hypothetical protein